MLAAPSSGYAAKGQMDSTSGAGSVHDSRLLRSETEMATVGSESDLGASTLTVLSEAAEEETPEEPPSPRHSPDHQSRDKPKLA